MSTSINDIHFSEIVELAAKRSLDGDFRPWREEGDDIYLNGMANVGPGYAELNRRIRANLRVSEVYVIGYPHTILRDSDDRKGGCGLLGNPVSGISGAEVDHLENYGLNLYFAHRLHAGKFGWNYFETRDLFKSRGYCAADDSRYIVRYRESCKTMGMKDGMLHPNRRGHEAIAERITEGMVFGDTPPPTKKLIVTVEAIHLIDFSKPDSRVETVVSLVGDRQGVREFKLLNNTLTPLPAAIGTFTTTLFEAPTLPRLTTAGALLVFGSLPGQVSAIQGPTDPTHDGLFEPLPGYQFGRRIDFGPSDNFGETDGVVVDKHRFGKGELEVYYRASVSIIPRIITPEPTNDPAGGSGEVLRTEPGASAPQLAPSP